MGEHDDLRVLARPFPKSLIHPPAQGSYGDYVKHSAVTEKLLGAVGGVDTHMAPVVRAPEVSVSDLTAAAALLEAGAISQDEYKIIKNKVLRSGDVEGVILSMTAQVDGRKVTVTEVGDAVGGGNWKNDGQRLKDGRSDAEKRCAMRLGVGLHLWSGNDYFLSRVLDKRAEDETGVDDDEPSET